MIRFLVSEVAHAGAMEIFPNANARRPGRRNEAPAFVAQKLLSPIAAGFEERELAVAYRDTMAETNPGKIFFLFEAVDGIEYPTAPPISKRFTPNGEIHNG